MKHTYDCEPTMTDTQVLDFCKKGFLMLEAVVPDEINKKTCDYCELYASGGPFKEDSVRLPDEIFELDWFADNVILNPEAIGVVRTLLGKNFQLPTFMANHRSAGPGGTGGWHRDAGSLYGPKIDSLKVFYYPQDTPFEMGPTDLLPGSHFLFAGDYMGHYTGIRGAFPTTAPAGSIIVCFYNIWHRKGVATAAGIRNLMKYHYVRTVPPERDWIIEPDFNVEQIYNMRQGHYFYAREGHRAFNDAAEIFLWLSGNHAAFRGNDSSLPVYMA